MNAPKRPLHPPQDSAVNDAIEETTGHIKAAGKLFFDFLLSDTQKDAIAFARGVKHFRPDLTDDLPEPGAPSPGYSNSPPMRPPGMRPGSVSVETDDEVIMIVEAEPEPCGFCRGRPVVAFNPVTKVRTGIACPKCQAPAKKLPKQIAK